MVKLKICAAAALGAAMLVLTGPAPMASANSWDYSDTSQDVIKQDRTTGDQQVAADVTGVDLVYADFRHTSRRVAFTGRVRAMQAVPWQLYVEVVLPNGTHRRVKWAKGHEPQIIGKSCAGIRRSVSGNTLTVSVPRRCFGNPTKVRMGAGIQYVSGNSLYVDDALMTRMPATWTSFRVTAFGLSAG